MRVELDVAVRRYENGRVLVGGEPPTLMRLSASGAAALDGLVAGVDHGPCSAGSAIAAFADRLIDAGMVHPVPRRGDPHGGGAGDVTVVVPVRDRAGELDRCLAALRVHGGAGLTICVVDDASHDQAAHAATAARHDAQFVALEDNAGPAGARNRGLAEVATPWVAFVDSDIEVTAGWLDPLLWVLGIGAATLVAPRIMGPAGPVGVVARYEASNSPLDMGAHRGLVAPRSRLAYVPAAAIVARVDAVRSLGGFDPGLTVGEDVDLIWRLVAAGQRCRYEPTSTVIHHHRSTPGAMLARRLAYGTSAALLDRRHPESVAPVRVARGDAATVAAVLAGRRLVAVASVMVGWALLSRRLHNLRHPHRTAALLVVGAQRASWYQLARALVRPWWPVSLAVAAVHPRARRRIVAGIVAVSAVEYRRRRPRLDPLRWGLLWVADEAVYSVGVWWGCLRERRAGPLLPHDGRN